MSSLNIVGDDSSIVSKVRSFQQVMAEGETPLLLVIMMIISLFLYIIMLE